MTTTKEPAMITSATFFTIYVPSGTIVERRNRDGSSSFVSLLGDVSIDGASRDEDGSYLYTVGRSAYRVAASSVA